MGLFSRRNKTEMALPKGAIPVDPSSFAIVKPEIGSNLATSLQSLKDRGSLKKKENWQEEAWTYYEQICEISYVMNTTAQTVAAADLAVEYLNEDPKCGWEQTGEMKAHRVLEALYGQQGTRSELMRTAALHLQVTGDSYFLGIPVKDDKGNARPNEFLWEFVSSDELVKSNTGKLSRKTDGCAGQGIPLDENTYAARLYRPHPRFSSQSDSNLRHCLVVAEELLFLTRLQKAMISSRLHAGILYVPSEMLQGAYDENGEGDLKSGNVDPVLLQILEFMINAVEDPCAVEAVAPLIVTGPAELEPKFQLKPFERQMDQQFIGIRKELIKRLGSGLDIPSEILDGKHGLNQSTGWQVSGEFLSLHVIPLGNKIAEFLTTNFLRPMLIECEGMSKEEACRFRINFDPTNIAQRQDQATIALRLHREGVISDKALREQSGLCEDHAPSIEDLKTNEDEKLNFYKDLIKSSPVAMGKILLPLVADLIDDEDLKEQADKLFLLNKDGTIREDVEAGGVDASDQDIDRVRPGGENRENEGNPSTTPSNDNQPDRPGTRARGEASAILIERLATTCDSSFERVHERAGAKLLTVAPASTKARLELTAKKDAFSVISSAELDETGKDVEFFFGGEYDGLKKKIKPWVAEWLMETHEVQEYVALEEAAHISEEIVSFMDNYTRVNLHEARHKFGNGLAVDSNEILELLQSTGRTAV